MSIAPHKLIIVAAPSGAGKTTIVQRLLLDIPNLEFSVSVTTRPQRVGERHGIDYFFVTVDEFKHRIENNEFAEWEEVYPGRYYGTLKAEIERIWANGNSVVFDIDVVGGLNIKDVYKTQALALFIQPPSIGELEIRLRSRGTETEETLNTRLQKAKYEMEFAPRFDVVVINDNLDHAISEAKAVVTQFISSEN